MEANFYWACGLLEGEGCFTEHTKSPYILVDMTDKDIIEKLKDVFPAGTIRGPYTHKNKPTHKPRWRFDLFGTKAIPVLKQILPYMGQRRSERIKYLLTLKEEYI